MRVSHQPLVSKALHFQHILALIRQVNPTGNLDAAQLMVDKTQDIWNQPVVNSISPILLTLIGCYGYQLLWLGIRANSVMPIIESKESMDELGLFGGQPKSLTSQYSSENDYMGLSIQKGSPQPVDNNY